MSSIIDDVTEETVADTTIDAVFFAQTHVLEPSHPYFRLVGERDTLIKVHVLSKTGAAAPPVKVQLALDEETESIELTGPAVLPETFNKEPGQVVHSFDDCFTATIPGRWIREEVKMVITAGDAERTLEEINIGPRIDLKMTMIDSHFSHFGFQKSQNKSPKTLEKC